MYLQWARWACSHTAKQVLLINMDETSLAYAYPNERGTVLVRKWLPVSRFLRKALALPKDLRGHVTYMAFICNVAIMQAHMPQILIGNEHFFTVAGLKSVAWLPANCFLWREKSAWVCARLLRRAISLLYAQLQPYLHLYQVVLVLDTFSGHMHRSISLLARRYGFQLVYVGALVIVKRRPGDFLST